MALKALPRFPIPFDIPRQLGMPIAGIARRSSRAARAIVLMPETSMHENHRSPGRKHEVRAAGQVAPMQAKAITEPMRQSTHHHLRTGVFPPHLAHALRSSRWGQRIRGDYTKVSFTYAIHERMQYDYGGRLLQAPALIGT